MNMKKNNISALSAVIVAVLVLFTPHCRSKDKEDKAALMGNCITISGPALKSMLPTRWHDSSHIDYVPTLYLQVSDANDRIEEVRLYAFDKRGNVMFGNTKKMDGSRCSYPPGLEVRNNFYDFRQIGTPADLDKIKVIRLIPIESSKMPKMLGFRVEWNASGDEKTFIQGGEAYPCPVYCCPGDNCPGNSASESSGE